MTFYNPALGSQVTRTTFDVVTGGQDKAFIYADSAINAALDYLTKIHDVTQQNIAIPASLNSLVLDDGLIKNEILALLNNSSGLSPAVEQQLWDRAAERTSAAMNAAIVQASRRLSSMGWDQPIGALAENIKQAEQAAAFENANQAREIAINQMKLEIDGIRFAISTELQRLMAEKDLAVQKIQIAVEMMRQNLQSLLQAAQAGAQISTQLAASALSVMNFNTSLGASSSDGVSHSLGVSFSVDGGKQPPPSF